MRRSVGKCDEVYKARSKSPTTTPHRIPDNVILVWDWTPGRPAHDSASHIGDRSVARGETGNHLHGRGSVHGDENQHRQARSRSVPCPSTRAEPSPSSSPT